MAKMKKTSTECVTGNVKKTSKSKGKSPTSPQTAQIPKRRGRPKGSKNKATTECATTECVNIKVKKNKGNVTKGSATISKKVSTECVDVLTESKGVMVEGQKKGRGRPRKKQHYVPEVLDESNLRTLCLIGYCTECHGMITTGDMAEGKTTIYKCMRCGKREKVTNLCGYKKPSKKPRSKKAFLKDVSGTHKELEVEKSYVPDEFQDIVENVNTSESWD